MSSADAFELRGVDAGPSGAPILRGIDLVVPANGVTVLVNFGTRSYPLPDGTMLEPLQSRITGLPAGTCAPDLFMDLRAPHDQPLLTNSAVASCAEEEVTLAN